ncbi:MAG: efflux RND transporter periplasmic adaptor subunit [Syntrophobacteraceae bacterium]
MKRSSKSILSVVILVGLIAGGSAWFFKRGNDRSVTYRTIPLTRGNLLATISATGTVEPEEVIDVGAQVAGKIVAFGKDKSGRPVDYGSTIEEGMILAQIDDSLYSADVAQARSQLEQARAGLLRAKADLGQLEARLFQAERDWNRAKKLGPSEALAQSDFDASKSAYDVAKANVEVGKAAIAQAVGTVAAAEASLKRAQQNLDYCTIRSPVKGVIIDRRVNIGQTVVASLNAPSLFLIARDLKRMQVWVAVNEADIGSIVPGQPVKFTVDALPDRTFDGMVGKIRLNASMTQNVVTYTVEVITDNSDGALLPYLTANARFMISERQNVWLAPNAALRYSPSPDGSAAGKERSASREQDRVKASPETGKTGAGGASKGTVWVQQDSQLRPISVTVGVTDGSLTEIHGDELKEGLLLVLGEERKDSQGAAAGGSPFTPRFFGRGSSSSGR